MAVDLEYLKRLLRDGAYALAQCREHARAVQRTTAGRRRTDWVGLL
jgi:IS5 family transposase